MSDAVRWYEQMLESAGVEEGTIFVVAGRTRE